MKRLFLVLLLLFVQISIVSAADDVVRINIWQEAAPLDPAYSTITENVKICSVAFDSLVQVQPDGKIVPGEAVSWTISDDRLVYTFKLKNDIFWSDGVPVTAGDYVLAFQRIVDPKVNETGKIHYLATNMKNAEKIIKGEVPPKDLGARAINDKTLEITLEAPASYFMAVLSYPGMAPVPRHVIKEKGNAWYHSKPMVSNGPFTVVKADKSGLIFKARKDHWDAPGFSQLELLYTTSQDSVLRDIVGEKLDIVEGVHRDQAEWTEGRKGIEAMHINMASTLYVVFNTKKFPFSDEKLRKAIRTLVDIRFLANGAKAKKAPMFSPPQLRTNSSELDRHMIKLNRDERVKKAEDLLAEAGYTAENPLEFDLLTADFGDYERVSFGLVSLLGIPSIKVKLKKVEYAHTYKYMSAGDFQMSLALWYADYPDPVSFYGTLWSLHPYNYSSWESKEYDTILSGAYSTQERPEREKLYSDMEDLIASKSPVVPLMHNVLSVFYRDQIDKPKVDPILGLNLRHLKFRKRVE